VCGCPWVCVCVLPFLLMYYSYPAAGDERKRQVKGKQQSVRVRVHIRPIWIIFKQLLGSLGCFRIPGVSSGSDSDVSFETQFKTASHLAHAGQATYLVLVVVGWIPLQAVVGLCSQH
jgi:hypothetical protein